ncbi:MAG: hypothetical protein FWD04_11380 [Conexibacteraceae bacterium]|nr:hypothetical protein [Conexibacteraceae bacterium]
MPHAAASPPTPARPRPGRPPRRVDAGELGEQLRDNANQIAELRAQLAALEAARLPLVHQALDRGWAHGQIAELTQLTTGRIGQISSARRAT